MKFYSEIWSILKILQGFETGVYVNKFVFEIACQSICIYTSILCTFFIAIRVCFVKFVWKWIFLKRKKNKYYFEINYEFWFHYLL